MSRLKEIRLWLRLWLQLSLYRLWDFLKLIYLDWFLFRRNLRQSVDRTLKIKLIALISSIGFILFAFLVTQVSVLLILPLIFAIPLLISMIVVVLHPVDIFLKKRKILQAQHKLRKYNIIVIWITWSYWKTSMKNMLAHVLWKKSKVLVTDWNKNTPLWISDLILSSDLQDIDIFVVEMWAFYPWDIHELCDIVRPSIWIITWITEQHLERFWSLEKIAHTKRELSDFVLDNWWSMYVNITDYQTQDILEKIWVDLTACHLVNSPNYSYIENFWWIRLDVWDRTFNIPLLGWYNAVYAYITSLIAKKWMNNQNIQRQLEILQHTKHRLELIRNDISWVTIIDDSYNWNRAWFLETAKLIKSQSVLWKKILLTPWIVELWDESKKIHEEIADCIYNSYDLYMLINTKWASYMRNALEKKWINSNSIITYETATEAHNSLWWMLNSWDVVVFQNDATDNYS